MKIVPFDERDENDVPAPIPEVSGSLYGELFFAADWAVMNRPWEESGKGILFEISDASGEETWQAFSDGGSDGVCVLSLVRKNGGNTSGEHDRLELQFIASDFLQGHDYELNVRFAPESWDQCERDVIVLRALSGDCSGKHPNATQVELLRDGLREWQRLVTNS